MIDDSIRFSLARVSFGARHHHGTERERERALERERKKERPVEYYTPKSTTLLEREKIITREEKRVLSNHKKKQKNSRDESLGFLFSLEGQISSSWDFFKLFFVVQNLSRKEERSTEKTTKTPTAPLDVSSIISDLVEDDADRRVWSRFLSPSLSLSLL